MIVLREVNGLHMAVEPNVIIFMQEATLTDENNNKKSVLACSLVTGGQIVLSDPRRELFEQILNAKKFGGDIDGPIQILEK